MLPLAIFILFHPPALSRTETFAPSWSTNKSTLEAPGALFTVIVGVKIMASVFFLPSEYFCAAMVIEQIDKRIKKIPTKKLIFRNDLRLEVMKIKMRTNKHPNKTSEAKAHVSALNKF